MNECGHRICSNCVELLFIAKPAVPCYKCGLMLNKSKYSVSNFDDDEIERDLIVRRKVLSDFNLFEEDFESVEEYDDYLEMVEEIIYNLANEIDLVDTKNKIETHKRKYRSKILANRQRLSREQQHLEDNIESERQAKLKMAMEDENADQTALSESLASKKNLLNNLQRANASDATQIYMEFNKNLAEKENCANISQIENKLVSVKNQHSTKIDETLKLSSYKSFNYGSLAEKILQIKIQNSELTTKACKQISQKNAGGHEKWFEKNSQMDFLIQNVLLDF